MELSDYIHATTQPFAALRRDVIVAGWLFQTRRLHFNMQAQTESNWCWAATSTSVSHYYWFGSRWTQCRVACAELNLSTCCEVPAPDACNVPWFLDRALTRTNNFVSISGPLTFDQVRTEIDAERPVGARIGWANGGGHFMVIYGYTKVLSHEYFDIDDPIFGKSHLKVSEFSNNYQTTGSWTHSYLTRSYIPDMFIVPYLVDQEIVPKIWAERPVLSVSLGEDALLSTEGRTLGLAHPIFTLGLDNLVAAEGTARQTGLRVLELQGQTPRAYYDVVGERVSQLSGANPYLDLFERALGVLTRIPAGERRYELRLLRVPALNFEALWAHSEDGAADKLIPLRSFHGFTAMQPVAYGDALERLRAAARRMAPQEDTMGG
jgi:hypothetical protein